MSADHDVRRRYMPEKAFQSAIKFPGVASLASVRIGSEPDAALDVSFSGRR